MKNSLIIASILFLTACGGGESSIDALIEEGNTDALKTKQGEIMASIKEAEADLKKIAAVLDGDSVTKKLPLVSVIEVEPRSFEHYFELQGSVQTDQNILVYPEIQGKLLDFKAKMGDRVQKGQVVATIDDGGLRQQLAQMKEQEALSKITYERQKRLWDQKIGSELEFLRTETTYNSNKEAVKQVEKQLEKAAVVAPFSGQIDETIADEGELVSPGQTPLFRLINLSNMYIQVDVPEKYLSGIKKGGKVLVSLPVLDTTITSTIGKVSNYINPDNRTFKVEIDVPNTNGMIKPNLTSKLKLNDYSNANAILIPQSIISEDSEGRQYVYKVNKQQGDKAVVEKTVIETGLKQGDYIEILSGLMGKEVLVQEGARRVKDQQEVEIIK